jgi:hypothetical protein
MADHDLETHLTLVADGGGYSLLGCYKRPGPGMRGGIFADPNEYITLIPVPSFETIIASCLEGCGTSVPSDDALEIYALAAISEGRYVHSTDVETD